MVGRDRRERKIGQPLLMEGAQSAGLRCEGVCSEKGKPLESKCRIKHKEARPTPLLPREYRVLP